MKIENPDARRNRAKILVWWIIWGGFFVGLATIYVFLGRGPQGPKDLPAEKMLTGLIGVIPLFVSVVIRWLVLPRYTDMNRALVMFIFGLGLAEGCGILGIFLGGPYRDDLFLLGLFGIVQFIPIFAKSYLEPKVTGFMPNN